MKTFFKVSLLGMFLVVSGSQLNASASPCAKELTNDKNDKSEAAQNITTALGAGCLTGTITAVAGSVCHYGAVLSGATPTQAAIVGIVGGGATGLGMSLARSKAIGDFLGQEYKAVAFMSAVGTMIIGGGLYYIGVGGQAAAAAAIAAKLAEKK